MWSALVGDNTCLVLQWLVGAAQHIESSDRFTSGARHQGTLEGVAEQAPPSKLPESEFKPDTPLALDRDAFLRSLKTAPGGSSTGPGST